MMFEQDNQPTNVTTQITSTTFSPTSGTLGMFEIDPTKYDANCRWLFQFSGSYDANGPADSQLTTGELYDDTNSTEITQSQATLNPNSPNYGLSTEVDFTSYVASKSAPFNVYPRFKVTHGSDTFQHVMTNIKVVQRGTILKTISSIPVGSQEVFTDTSLTEVVRPKRFVYSAANYDGTVTPRVIVVGQSDSGSDTVTFELWDVTAAASRGTVTTVATVPTLLVISPSALTNGNVLTIRRKISAGTGTIYGANLNVEQSGTSPLTKLQTVVQTCNRMIFNATATYKNANSNVAYNNNRYQGLTLDFKMEYVLLSALAGLTAFGDTIDDGTTITSSELSTTAATPTIKTSGSLTAPTGDGNVIDSRLKQSPASGLNSFMYSGRIMLTITSMLAEHLLPQVGIGM